MESIFDRHSNVALSLSGGRDSLACLYLFRPHWDKLTVYWLNTGDAFPETVEFMHNIRKMVPNFVELHGQQKQIVKADGWPSDVVVHSHTTDGNALFGGTPFKMQSRLSCCYRSMMLPAYQQMTADGVTCIIRGKRFEEADKSPFKDGSVDSYGVELRFPIYNWTAADVTAYLVSQGVELPRFYLHGEHSIDCMSCTAFWEDGHGAYLKNEHPEKYVEWTRRIGLIKQAVAAQMAVLGD